MNNKVTSRIKIQMDGVSASNKEDWQKINKFLIDTSIKMKDSMKEEISQMKEYLKK